LRMAPHCQQTVSQVQKDCEEGDEVEVVAKHVALIVSNEQKGVNCNSVASGECCTSPTGR
jgi:hypothetical protein